MTTGKPPQPLHKTLLGMPSDLQEALAKLRAERQTPQKPAEPEAAPSAEAASRDLASTWYGNAHEPASAPSAGPARSPWPNLPQSQAFRPPALPAGVDGPRRPNPSSPTLLGLSGEVEAAFRELQAHAPAVVTEPLPAQLPPHVEAHAARDRSIWPPPPEANPWAERRAVEPLPVAARRPPSAASAVPTRLGLSGETSLPPHAAPAGARVRTATPPPLKTRSSLDGTEPDRARSSAPQPRSPFEPGAPSTTFDGGVTVAEFRDELALGPAPTRTASPQPEPVQTAAFASFEPAIEPSSPAFGSSAPVELAWPPRPVATRPPIAARIAEPSIRRWPALTLIGAALIGFVVLVVVRAPGLLPNLGAHSSTTTSTNSATASDHNASPPSAASATGDSPQALTAELRVELEKQAADLLTANDYAGARVIYRRLSVAEPTRADYARMLTFLTHKLDSACGAAGQPACAPR